MKSKHCILLGCIVVSALVGCTQRGFECGVPAADNPQIVTRCDRPQEICVCATRSCARPAGLDADGGSTCASGYRYTEAPFASPDYDHECVPESLVQDEKDFLSNKEIGMTCEPFEAAMPEPPMDSGMDSGDGNMPDGDMPDGDTPDGDTPDGAMDAAMDGEAPDGEAPDAMMSIDSGEVTDAADAADGGS